MQDMSAKEMPLEEHRETAAVDFSPEEERKLVRKIDLYLMPAIFVLYLFSFVVSPNHFQTRREC